MVTKQFPYNTVINCIQYDAASKEMVIHYSKQTRRYAEVPKEIFYQWYYLNDLKQLLSYYAKNIKKKFKIIHKAPF